MTFAERLKRIREERALTQQALAELIDVRQSAISNLENGVSKPSYDLLIALSSALNLSTSVLMEGVTA